MPLPRHCPRQMQQSVKHPWRKPKKGEALLVLDDAEFRVGGTAIFSHTQWTWRGGECWGLVGGPTSGRNDFIHGLCGDIPHVSGDLDYAYTALAPHLEDCPEEGIAHVLFEDQQVELADRSTFAQSRWNSGLDTDPHHVDTFLSFDEVHEINPYEVVDSNPAEQKRFAALRRYVIALLEIAPLLDRTLDQLSNGERRKVFLARALLSDPVLLILEHPFEGLDQGYAKHLHRVFRTLIKDGLQLMFLVASENDLPAYVTHLGQVQGHQLVAQGKRRATATKPSRKNQRAIALPPEWKKRLRKRKLNTPIAELNKVDVQIDDKAILHGVNWTIQPSECWALAGPNGAGKSTLLSLLQGDNPQAYANDLTLFGKPLGPEQSIWDVKQRVSSVSPEAHLHFPGDLTVLEVVCTGFFNTIRLFDGCGRVRRNIAREWLEALGLDHERNTLFSALSTEQQRHVLIARAVVKQVDLLILDEPGMGLAPASRDRLLGLIDRVVKATGTTLIYVSHRRDEWPSCISHRLCLKDGKVTRSGPFG